MNENSGYTSSRSSSSSTWNKHNHQKVDNVTSNISSRGIKNLNKAKQESICRGEDEEEMKLSS